jgi:peptide/nickel transport system substrate-binding protein
MRRLIKAGAVLAAVTLAGALAACGSNGGGSGGTAAKTATLTISNENGALWTCDFSPFNGSDTLLSVGLVYETLDYVNPLQNGKVTPMLASSYSWGAGDKSVTFTIRSGVKFSNGTPLSANDVAYTFNLLKKYPALDLPGVWSVLSSVTATGDQVTMDFSAPAVPWF